MNTKPLKNYYIPTNASHNICRICYESSYILIKDSACSICKSHICSKCMNTLSLEEQRCIVSHVSIPSNPIPQQFSKVWRGCIHLCDFPVNIYCTPYCFSKFNIIFGPKHEFEGDKLTISMTYIGIIEREDFTLDDQQYIFGDNWKHKYIIYHLNQYLIQDLLNIVLKYI